MELDNLFWAAFQSSLVLGLVHGVNPCGHSWLVLAPFVTGERKGPRVALLTAAFLLGTVLACLLLGLSLGAVAATIPQALEQWVHVGTSVFLIVIGALLICNPRLLHHHHDHDPGHDHIHDHAQSYDHDHDQDLPPSAAPPQPRLMTKKNRVTGLALLGIGFVNMVIPCPTVAIMYTYALDSGHFIKATAVFAVYALGTSIAVAAVIYAIFKVTNLLHTLAQDWIETAIMRGAGLVTMIFALYALIHG